MHGVPRPREVRLGEIPGHGGGERQIACRGVVPVELRLQGGVVREGNRRRGALPDLDPPLQSRLAREV